MAGDGAVPSDGTGPGRHFLPILAGGLLLLFLAAPWPLEHKAHAALHGLCAQRPSHSLSFDGRTLPFDARMTGIYGGFLTAAIYLTARRRYLAARLPTWPVMATLALFVAVLAVDGFNSLLLDLGHWHPYGPDNRLRLFTGLTTGTTLAVVMAYVAAISLWRRPRLDQRVVQARDLASIAVCMAPVAALALSGAGSALRPDHAHAPCRRRRFACRPRHGLPRPLPADRLHVRPAVRGAEIGRRGCARGHRGHGRDRQRPVCARGHHGGTSIDVKRPFRLCYTRAERGRYSRGCDGFFDIRSRRAARAVAAMGRQHAHRSQYRPR